MRIYHNQDADISLIVHRRIAVIGYGNQGQAQALNLRDSGLDVVIGNREDAYAQRAREDGFSVSSIGDAVQVSDIVLLLVPDEVAPDVFTQEIAPYMSEGDVLAFASGYDIAFGLIKPPPKWTWC